MTIRRQKPCETRFRRYVSILRHPPWGFNYLTSLKFKKLLHKFDIKSLPHPFGNAGFSLFEDWPKTNKKNKDIHCEKTFRIASFSGRYFLAFWLNYRISPHSVRMRENKDQKNFEYAHFSRRRQQKRRKKGKGVNGVRTPF